MRDSLLSRYLKAYLATTTMWSRYGFLLPFIQFEWLSQHRTLILHAWSMEMVTSWSDDSLVIHGPHLSNLGIETSGCEWWSRKRDEDNTSYTPSTITEMFGGTINEYDVTRNSWFVKGNAPRLVTTLSKLDWKSDTSKRMWYLGLLTPCMTTLCVDTLYLAIP